MIGRVLGHYRILEQIGAGGMGHVYRAADERLQRDVALKVLPPGTLHDETARKNFRKEALTLSRLNHPHIATVHDFDTQDNLDFLVMEFVPGISLGQRLADVPLTEKEIAKLGTQVADALQEAHENGIVHRDLKPANIALTAKGQAKVLDFGLAQWVERILPGREAATADNVATSTSFSGTVPYMPPEQLRGEAADTRADIYALGAVMYEMATQRRAFPESGGARLIDAVLNRVPVPPRSLNPRISAELERIILKSLEKDPEDRYQSAKEISVDLRRLGGRAPEAKAPSPQMRRRVLLAAALAVPVLAALAVVGFNLGGMRDRLFARGAAGPIQSLAVLPLSNLSGNPEQEYFADGMTEALISELSKISALKVISRTSVMQYKQVKKPLPKIASELNVDAIVEGSVLREGEQVRITVQLIQGSTDKHLWAESYQRELRNILTLQSEVAQAIAREIRVAITPTELPRLAGARAVNPEAHEAYLKGLFFMDKRTPEGFQKAKDYFQQAIDTDPTYAQAYAGLSFVYSFLKSYGLMSPAEACPKAKALAQKAIELDAMSPEAHVAVAAMLEDWDWDWAGAEREYKKAIELNPSYEIAFHWYGFLLLQLQRHSEALAALQQAKKLAPLSPRINADVGWAYSWAGDYDRAIQEYRKALEIDPNFASTHALLGWAQLRQSQPDLAIAEFKNAVALSGGNASYWAGLGYAYGVSGKRNEALKILAQLKEQSKRGFVSAYDFAILYAGLGEREHCLESLEKSYKEHAFWLPFIRQEPAFAFLRSEPRFQQLVARLHFPQ